jgi:hypothetical protein
VDRRARGDVDINRAIKNVVLGTDDFGWGPNNQFKFPLFGGTASSTAASARRSARRITRSTRRSISSTSPRRKSASADGEIVKYDRASITAMPLDKLCNDVINGEMPREIKKAAASLPPQRRVHGRRRHQAAVPEHEVVDVFS